MPRGHVLVPWPERWVMASLPPPPFTGTAAAINYCIGNPPPLSNSARKRWLKTRLKKKKERKREAGHSKFKISLLLAV